MIRILLAALLLGGATVSGATPLSEWNLNLGALGGADATHIGTVTLNGFSELDQTIIGNSGFGQAFTFSGSLQWMQYQQSGAFGSLSFGLPATLTRICISASQG